MGYADQCASNEMMIEKSEKYDALKKENSILVNLLKKAEDDLYHICLFNPTVKSKYLSEIEKYLRSTHTDCKKG